jgi:hypothetical protein
MPENWIPTVRAHEAEGIAFIRLLPQSRISLDQLAQNLVLRHSNERN